MADPQADKPKIIRLESAPGWQTRTSAPAAKPAKEPKPAASAAPPTASAAPKAHQKPIWSSFSLPRLKMPQWSALRPDLRLDNLPKIQLPKIRLPKIKLPALSLSAPTRKQLVIAAAATATFTLAALFARYAGAPQDGQDGYNPAPDPNAEAVIKVPPQAKAPATKQAASQKQEQEKPQEQKAETRLTTLQDLPPIGQAKDEDIRRLMSASKLPRDVVEEALHIFSNSTPDDYKSKPGDKIELVYSQGLDVLFARVHADKKTHDIYGFEDRHGNYSFYTERGRRIDKSGMTSPVDQFEINSPRLTRVFRVYNHPIHKVRKHHDGIDFPVPRGTPIYAVSDGVITASKRQGGYGKTISIAHNDVLSSRYAHLDRYAGLKPGARVQKGQLIGYAGNTGWSTGPHLHFEILKNGKAINPRTITAFSAPVIAKAERGDFNSAVTRIKDYLAGNPDPLTAKADLNDSSTMEKIKDLFHRPGDEKINKIIVEAARRDGIPPDLPYRLFIKEATVKGQLNEAARSDTGASGLCQFTSQTFLAVMKKHGPRLGFAAHADKIRSYIGEDKATHYTADRHTGDILKLRADKNIAIPLCTAYMRDNIDHLKEKLGRTPNFTDVSIAHFFGPGIAAEFIPAYDNPRTRKQHAHKYAQHATLTGATNRSVFFKDGDRSKPYTVEEVYNKKRAQMGTEPALIAAASAQPAREHGATHEHSRDLILLQPH